MDEKNVNSQRFAFLILLILLCMIVGLVCYILGKNSRSLEVAAVSPSVSVLPSPTSTPNAYELNRQTFGYQAQNGYVISGEDYVEPNSCSNLTVSAGTDNDCYVLLKYRSDVKTAAGQILFGGTYSAPPSGTCPNGTFAFYICAGNTATVDVPLGTAEVLYATGTGWAGATSCFGKNTQYYTTGDDYDFTNHTYTLTLHAVPDGNFTPQSITSDAFSQ